MLASRLGKLPVWLFQGSADELAPPGDARRMWRALQSVNPNAKYTEYESGGHDQTKAMSDPGFWRWLLGQRRSARK